MASYSGAVHVHRLSERGVEVSTFALPQARFWLPREGHVSWVHRPCEGADNTVVLPEWLRDKHKQLIGDPAFKECASASAARSGEGATPDRDRDGTGALFRNVGKEEASKQPDYKGHVVLDGKRYQVAGWVRDRKQGTGKFLSLAIQPADQRNGTSAQR